MDTQSLQAGRELDRTIAERVFGRNPLEARHGLHDDGDLEYHWGYPIGHDVAPHYSTDIAAAWQVVEQLRKDSAELTLKYESYNNPDTHYRWRAVFFAPLGDGTWGTDAVGDTAPLAICRAALIAAEKGHLYACRRVTAHGT